MQREYKTTEFWAVVVGAALWLIDRYAGTNLFDIVADGQPITEAKAQVLAIAAQLRQATGANESILLYAAMAVYFGRKIEKIVSVWRLPVAPAADR